MASIQNGVQPKLQIGKLAKRTALSIDAVRFYERRKLLPPAFRSAGRFRLYATNDVERLRFVQRMQRLGFSLEEIKELMTIRGDAASLGIPNPFLQQLGMLVFSPLRLEPQKLCLLTDPSIDGLCKRMNQVACGK